VTTSEGSNQGPYYWGGTSWLGLRGIRAEHASRQRRDSATASPDWHSAHAPILRGAFGARSRKGTSTLVSCLALPFFPHCFSFAPGLGQCLPCLKIALSVVLPWPNGQALPLPTTGEQARRMRFSIACVSTWLHTSYASGMFWQRGSVGVVFVALLQCARAGPTSQHINTSSAPSLRLIFSS